MATPSMRRRIGPWAIGVLVATAIGLAVFFTLRQPEIPVDLGQVSRGPMAVTIDDEAETRAHDVFVVSAPIGGRLLRVSLEAGDLVRAGQTIVARIVPADPGLLDARTYDETSARIKALAETAKSAEARIVEARAERDLARREFERSAAVHARGFVSKATMDRARMNRDRSAAMLVEAERSAAAARYNLAAARATLERASTGARDDAVTIRAPVSGRVLRIVQKSEATVGAGVPLVEIGDPATLELVTDLLSADAVQIKPGAVAILDQWGGKQPIPARVRLVEPYGFTKVSALGVEEQRVNVILDFTGPAAGRERLGHGYRGIVRIVTWSSPDVLRVPASALFRVGDDWAVFVVDGNRARLVRVRIGATNPDLVQLLDPLAPGTKVILHPGDRVADGVRIKPRPA
jgi:HlyD family secretion protein